MKNKEAINVKEEKNSNFSIKDGLNSLYNKVSNLSEGKENESESDRFLEAISEAYREWKNAESFFDNVSDPLLIDHAIYRIEAAKARYVYLLKEAKEQNINVDLH